MHQNGEIMALAFLKFDTVDFNISLGNILIPLWDYSWFKSYIFGRHHYVINHQKWGHQTWATITGFIMLFIIYINDFVNSTKIFHKVFY